MSKFTTIRDPVYNYLKITSIEKVIIDRPDFQRLRFVLQNSSAYLTYPSNNNSRFLHSLGVMHLAGEMVSNALQRASKEDLQEFLQEFSNYIDKFCSTATCEVSELHEGWRSILGDVAQCTHSPYEGDLLPLSEDQRFLINTIWQSVRLAALIHDIGHFPLSHLFEYAFMDFFVFAQDGPNPFEKEYIARYTKFRKCMHEDLEKELPPTDYPICDLLKEHPLHELWGALLFHTWMPSNTLPTRERLFYNLIFRLAKVISIVNPIPPEGDERDSLHIFRALHSIVASELDADRLDYSVRDPLSSGLELGAIDVTRIVRSMTLVKDCTSSRFVIVPDAHSLSALESFYHQRYLVYRYLIYHHNVVRLDEIAQEIVYCLLSETASGTSGNQSPLGEIINQFGFWISAPDKKRKEIFHFLGRGFQYYDDAWLRTLMSQCLLKLEGEKEPLPERLKNLPLLLEIFLYRQTQHVSSLWKRESDYHATIETLFNELTIESGYSAVSREDIRGVLSPTLETTLMTNLLIKPLRKELKEQGVVLLYRLMKPKLPHKMRRGVVRHDASRISVLVAKELKDCCEVSSYLRSLTTALDCPTIYFGFVTQNLKSNTVLNKKCAEIVMQHLKSYVKSTFCQLDANVK